MADENFWTLFRKVAQSSGCELTARVNLDRPDAGIIARRTSESGSDFRLLSISASDDGDGWFAKLVDCYTRGDDMVTTYAGTDRWPFSPQIYWTVPADRAGDQAQQSLSLLVSIQTDRLDTHPRIFVRSSLPTDDVLLVTVADDEQLVDSHVDSVVHVDPQATAYCPVWRLPGGELSYAEIMLTSDFRALRIERKGESSNSQWELFSEFLEKGVIRRARIHAAFLPRENDVQLAANWCRVVEHRPLPLTT